MGFLACANRKSNFDFLCLFTTKNIKMMILFFCVKPTYLVEEEDLAERA
jgi:hypothetical protein